MLPSPLYELDQSVEDRQHNGYRQHSCEKRVIVQAPRALPEAIVSVALLVGRFARRILFQAGHFKCLQCELTTYHRERVDG
jgi:hypothetical protein